MRLISHLYANAAHLSPMHIPSAPGATPPTRPIHNPFGLSGHLVSAPWEGLYIDNHPKGNTRDVTGA